MNQNLRMFMGKLDMIFNVSVGFLIIFFTILTFINFEKNNFQFSSKLSKINKKLVSKSAFLLANPKFVSTCLLLSISEKMCERHKSMSYAFNQ